MVSGSPCSIGQSFQIANHNRSMVTRCCQGGVPWRADTELPGVCAKLQAPVWLRPASHIRAWVTAQQAPAIDLACVTHLCAVPTLRFCTASRAVYVTLLSPQIAKRRNAHQEQNPDCKIISLGIGDTTEPLTPTIVNAMSEAALGFGTREGYSGCDSMPCLPRRCKYCSVSDGSSRVVTSVVM